MVEEVFLVTHLNSYFSWLCPFCSTDEMKALWLKGAQKHKQVPKSFLGLVFHIINFLFFLFLLTLLLSYLSLKALSCVLFGLSGI